MSNQTVPSTNQTTIPLQHPEQNPDLAVLLQCHLTPSVLSALLVLYPKVFLPN